MYCIRYLLILNSLSFFSCNNTEEIWLDKNGKGRYRFSIETTSEGGKLLMEQFNENQALDNIFDMATRKNIDSIFPAKLFFDKFEPTYPQIFGRTMLNVKSDIDSSKLWFRIEMPFDNVEELNEGISNFWLMKSSFLKDNFEDTVKQAYKFYSFRNNTLIRSKIEDYSGAVSQEQRSIGEMLFKDCYHTLIFYMPKKPKSVSYNTAEIKDNTMTVRISLLEIFSGEAAVTGEITY